MILYLFPMVRKNIYVENRQIYSWKQENHQSYVINKIINTHTLHTNIAETHTHTHAHMGFTH